MHQRKVPLLAAILVLSFSSWALAQKSEDSTPSPSNPNPTSTSTAKITIRGCITGGKRYTFMQASTGAVFALNEDTVRFGPVTGKLIEVTANERAPQPKSDELPQLQIDNLKVVAAKCPIQARKENTAAAPVTHSGQNAETSPATEPYVDPGTSSQTPPNVNNPNITGDTGAPSPGTGNPPSQPQSNSPQ